jgi:hypothetical protein
MADRYDELMAAVCQDDADRTIYEPLVRKAVLLEARLEELEALPHIVIHPTDPTKQKTTPAHKQYKELLQQYANVVKILGKVNGVDASEGESPLRAWARARTGAYAD